MLVTVAGTVLYPYGSLQYVLYVVSTVLEALPFRNYKMSIMFLELQINLWVYEKFESGLRALNLKEMTLFSRSRELILRLGGAR